MKPGADEAFPNHSHGKRQDVSGVQMSKNEKQREGKKKKERKENHSEDFAFHLGRHMGLGSQCQYKMRWNFGVSALAQCLR
ncbi:uncharacterized, partial [Tachysurus ichikawai]